ncbi:small integral membrane protein 8 isoform X2 [Sturnira hondurensis]|uniref:small integral membrane protein 8 isoform X2 n=1 Tax=Sturnira hondurensis TaxID=192404 RepID=UPI001879A0A2|nr:small integral membrane protein 8 isoform X2 [Sturnira hondurensis]
MSSAPEPPAFKNEPPKEKDFQNPGLRGVRTTTLFRAVNPELFIKPDCGGLFAFVLVFSHNTQTLQARVCHRTVTVQARGEKAIE